jgi:hypothetical protein
VMWKSSIEADDWASALASSSTRPGTARKTGEDRAVTEDVDVDHSNVLVRVQYSQ